MQQLPLLYCADAVSKRPESSKNFGAIQAIYLLTYLLTYLPLAYAELYNIANTSSVVRHWMLPYKCMADDATSLKKNKIARS